MTRNAFHTQLEAMNRDLMRMSAQVQQQIATAIAALTNRDVAAAQQVIDGDRAINAAYAQIESTCLGLLVLQQPVAVDARRITSSLKVITDLERMGDHAVAIAKAVVRMGGEPLIKPLVLIPAMGELAQQMVEDAVSAFISGNRERALAMIQKDNELDHIHSKVITGLTELMRQDSTTVAQGVQLLFVSHSLERIGDHATNLGEWLIFVVTGHKEDMNV